MDQTGRTRGSPNQENETKGEDERGILPSRRRGVRQAREKHDTTGSQIMPRVMRLPRMPQSIPSVRVPRSVAKDTASSHSPFFPRAVESKTFEAFGVGTSSRTNIP